MTQSKHTPGPWFYQVDLEGRYYVGHTFNPRGQPELWRGTHTREDAALVAAAPDLLAACKAALERIDGMNESMGVVDELRAAIAKAEGGAA